MNRAFFMGRLTADPEIRYTQDQKPVIKFGFAVDRRYKREGDADADFFTCVAFGKTAETFEKCSIRKGTKLLIDSEVRNNNYTKTNGEKVYSTQIVVNSFEFCESKTASQRTEPEKGNDIGDGFMQYPDNMDDDDLPFN